MICTNCGKEVFGDARFCPNCATRLEAASTQTGTSTTTAAPRVPRRRGKLWNLHTYDWSGSCPKCGTHHTHENTRCPNDKSPLVVAFDCWRWNPFVLPMHTAHLRCSGNCGYATTNIHCTTGDGGVIGSVNVEFRPRLLNVLIHNLTFVTLGCIAVVIAAFIVFSGVRLWFTYQEHNHRLDTPVMQWFGAFALSFLGLLPWAGWVWDKSRLRWWPFRRTFDFEATARAAAMRRGV